jgi:hypothetical protein
MEDWWYQGSMDNSKDTWLWRNISMYKGKYVTVNQIHRILSWGRGNSDHTHVSITRWHIVIYPAVISNCVDWIIFAYMLLLTEI